jgi:hypothetical protein
LDTLKMEHLVWKDWLFRPVYELILSLLKGSN